jgi:hypothetical protein
MIEIKCSKILSYIVNAILLLYQLPQLITGLIGLAVFHNYEWYYNKEAGVKVLRVDKGSFIKGACFSSGPIIFVTKNCDENTLLHETGHSKQSLVYGPLFHILVSLPSIIRFWIRRLFNKSHEWYLSGWPEFQAEKWGHTHRT